MRDANGGVGFIDVLAAGSGRAVRIDAQLRWVQVDRFDFLKFRQNRHRASRGVNSSLRFGRRHALYTMSAGFELEQGIGAASDDAADDFLISAMFAGALAQDFDAPAFGLGVTGVHA